MDSPGMRPSLGGQFLRGVSQVTRKVDIRLPGKGDSNSHGARPVY